MIKNKPRSNIIAKKSQRAKGKQREYSKLRHRQGISKNSPIG